MLERGLAHTRHLSVMLDGLRRAGEAQTALLAKASAHGLVPNAAKERFRAVVLSGGRREVLEQFELLLERGDAECGELDEALKHCDSSSEQEDVLLRAMNAGVSPGRAAFTIMLTQLQIEARSKTEVLGLLLTMRSLGVEEDAFMKRALGITPAALTPTRPTHPARVPCGG